MKKFIITVICIFSFVFNAYAGSDGELALNKDEPKKIKDCFEKLNRATFSFNQGLDKAIIKPIAKGYRNLPVPIQKGTKNAVTNLSNLITIPNNVLQGDVKTAIINTGRLVVNTTVGLLGTIDVANKMGFPKYEREDYGQTLGAWGVGPGCYVVLPVLGPSTIRDTAGSFANVLGGDPWYNASIHGNNEFLTEGVYITSKALDGVNFRSENLESLDNLETNSIDFYASLRSLYLQDRENKIQNNQRGRVFVHEQQDQNNKKQRSGNKEKIIFRLKQLGYVKDWTVDFNAKTYEVEWRDQEIDELSESIFKTISKYSGEQAELKQLNDKLTEARSLLTAECERGLIRVLLEWNYDHFVYQRRQSLKNLYEACADFKDNENFKEKLETENRILKRKLRRLQNEHLSSLRQ